MKKTFLTTSATAILAVASTFASASDLPGRYAAPAPAPVYAQFSWAGFYAGLNAGGTFGSNNRCGSFFPSNNLTGVAVVGFLPNCGISGSGNSGFTGGAQVGYNWQTGSFVYGVEGDIDFINGRRRGANTVFAPGAPIGYRGTYVLNNGGGNNGNVFGTARLRAGYAYDRLLLYVTGGLAFGGRGTGSSSATYFTGAGVPADIAPANRASVYSSGGGNNSRVGYALGAGLEYAFTNNWTVKGEYLYANFGGGKGARTFGCTDVILGTCAAQPGTTFVSSGRRNNDVNLVRIGVNYKF